MFLFDTSRVTVKIIIGIFLCFNIPAFANQCNNNSSIADVVEKLSPAIVNISTTQLVENGNKNLPFSEDSKTESDINFLKIPNEELCIPYFINLFISNLICEKLL